MRDDFFGGEQTAAPRGRGQEGRSGLPNWTGSISPFSTTPTGKLAAFASFPTETTTAHGSPLRTRSGDDLTTACGTERQGGSISACARSHTDGGCITESYDEFIDETHQVPRPSPPRAMLMPL